MKNLKVLIATFLFMTSLLVSPLIAQKFNPNGDDDGDGLKNLADFCPSTTGPAENKGCPEKPLTPGQTAKPDARTSTPGCIFGDCINGFSKFNLGDGDYYEGMFVNQKRHGKGIYIWGNGKKYVGDFKDGIIEGLGIMYHENGDVYQGYFVNGLRHGKSHYALASGYVYHGEFKEGKRDGYGITYDKDGKVYEEGIFTKGVMTYAFAPKKGDAADDYNTLAEVVLPPGIQVRKDYSNPNNEGQELYAAIEKGDDAKALELMKNGINLNYRDPKWSCPLGAAILYPNTKMAKMLLLAGADPNCIGAKGFSPLLIAVQSSNREIVELLINKYKVKVNSVESGYSALHIAADFNSTAEIMKILLDAGSDPNFTDGGGDSALSQLQMKDNPNKEMIDLLLAASSAQIKEAYYKQKAINEAEYAKREAEYEKEEKNSKIDTDTGNQAAALREYDRVHPQIEAYARRYAAALGKYRRAGEAQFLYKGTAANIIDTQNKALDTIRTFLKKHGANLPKNLKEHLEEDAALFGNGPSY